MLSKELKQALLRFIYEPSLDAWAHRNDNLTYALLSTIFIRNWKRWLHNPSENPRPDGVDNSSFFCQHDLLLIDPNCPGDLERGVEIIQRGEWDILQSLYVSHS